MFENTYKVLNEYGNRLVELYKKELTDGKINASYDLYNSVRSIFDDDGKSFEIKLELEDYWKYIENGRKAGKFPPINAIEKWIEIKPVMPYPFKNGKLPTTPQLAKLIARKIGLEGIEPKPILQKSVDEIMEDIYKDIENALYKDFEKEIGFALERLV
jgi:hypothetical protein